MKRVLILCVVVLLTRMAVAQIVEDSVRPSRPWRAAAEVIGINAFVHCYDRFIAREDFAKTTLHSIRDNFKRGFVWDNDNFNTNMFAHPYHGNLYFSAARSNGMNFWQSYPYALGGSLMWEFFGENTPPSINDLFATSIGGAAIGETTYRISSIVLDDSKRGWQRVWREVLGGVVNPVRLINRLITGDAWRVRSTKHRYHDFDVIPLDFEISAGARYLAEKGSFEHGDFNPYVNLLFHYGDPLGEVNEPYDFFSAEATFGFSNRQPLVNAIHLVGQLWDTPILSNQKIQMNFGFYQHFNFYNSEAIRKEKDIIPYRIGETASVGAGFVYRIPQICRKVSLEQRLFLNGIILGGSLSDHYHVQERDYSLGSGFSAKLHTFMEFGRYGRLSLFADIYKLYTWKGYDEELVAKLDNLDYINAQGDAGSTTLIVLNPRLQLNITRHLLLDLYGSYFYRRSIYRDHDDVSMKTFELRAGLTYNL
ncbi:DUF3943 domain-containing protein [Prevotella sp. tf2-5]|uniref:DUF3943 domain-containing protein n=1 Tax=Prevotella sp. tf2-5 TaxID=1761889 RepID=UPI0008EEEFB7|nr:DUF3943 domain-containing protein [Prevotella sp. tf2-5]SFO51162.1 protein of unknown function [Prevotella sp. tf2-5]